MGTLRRAVRGTAEAVRFAGVSDSMCCTKTVPKLPLFTAKRVDKVAKADTPKSSKPLQTMETVESLEVAGLRVKQAL